MATRVNTRFILILLIAIIGAGGIVGGLWVLQYRKDATRNIRKGDQFAQAAMWDEARGQYGRAVQKEPDNADYVDKLEEATLNVVPTTPDQARELYNGYVSVLQHRVQHFANDPAVHLRLLEELRESSQRGLTNWRAMVESAERALMQFGPSHEIAPKAKFYRGLARTKMRSTLSDSELDEIDTDLGDYLVANPTDGEAWAILIQHQAAIGADLYVNDLRRESREQMDLADATYQEALDAGAAGPHLALTRQALIATRSTLGQPLDVEQLQLATEALRDAVRANMDELDERLVVDAANRMTVIRGGAEEGVALAQAWTEDHPPAYDARLAMAQLQAGRGQMEDAVNTASAVLQDLTDPANQPTAGLEAMLLHQRRANASFALFNFAYQRWDNAAADEKQTLLATLESSFGDVERYAEIAGLNQLVDRAAGRLAYANGEYRAAVDILEGAVAGGGDPATLRVLAAAHQRLGNVGVALQHITKALAAAPNDIQINYDNLRYSLQLRRVATAQASMQLLERVAPDDARVQRLRAEFDRLASGDAGTDNSDNPVVQAFELASEHLSDGKHDDARAILLPMLEDERLKRAALEMLVRVEYAADDRETAQAYLAQAMEMTPDAQSLQRLRAVLDNDDPIDAMAQFAQATHDDPGREALAMLNTLASYTRAWKTQRDRAQQRSDLSLINEYDELIARAERERPKFLEQARENLPADDSGLFEYEFSSALIDKQWQAAERMIATHNSSNWNLDGCDGLLFQGRLSLIRGNPEAAITTLLEATQRAPYSPQAWRSLGLAYGQVGNVSESQRAFERAYQSNPNNIATALVFVDSLAQTGQELRALEILTDLRRLAPRNQRVQSQYLNVLAQSGNEVEALRERLAMYADDPTQTDNALRLAMLLVSVVPERSLIVDTQGETVYSTRQWQQMSAAQQQQVIRDVREAWEDQAGQILAAATDQLGNDIRYVSTRAAMLERLGKTDQAVAFLEERIDSAPRSERSIDVYLALSSLFVRLGRQEDALSTLAAAQELENAEDQRASVAMGDVLFQLRRFEQARQQFLAVLEQKRSREVELKLIDTLIRIGEVEAARTRLDSVVDDLGADMTSWMLAANLAARQATEAEQAGRISEADFHREQVVNHLDEAARVNPRSTAPQLQLARYHYQRYSQTNDTRHLDRALRTLDGVERIDARNEQTRLLRVDVLLAKGDQRGAIGSLRRYVEENPDNDNARSVLITMLARTGQMRDVEALLREAVARNPNSHQWRERLGDHLRSTQARPADVITAYTSALDIEPTVSVIDKLVLYLVASAGDNPQRAESVLLQYEDLVDANAMLVLNEALVEHALERQATAERSLARSLRMIAQDELNEQQRRAMYNRWVNAAIRVLDRDVTSIESVARAESEELHPEVLRGLGKLVVAVDSSNLRDAITYYNRAMDQIGSTDDQYAAVVEFERGTLYTMKDDTAEAMASFERVLEVLPDHALALNNYAYLLAEKRGDATRALEPAQRAAAAAPDNPSVRDTLGRVLFLLGRHDDAARELQASLDLSLSATVLVHFAEVEIARGRLDQARAMLEQASQLQPDSSVQADIKRLTDDIEARSAGS